MFAKSERQTTQTRKSNAAANVLEKIIFPVYLNMRGLAITSFVDKFQVVDFSCRMSAVYAASVFKLFITIAWQQRLPLPSSPDKGVLIGSENPLSRQRRNWVTFGSRSSG